MENPCKSLTMSKRKFFIQNGSLDDITHIISLKRKNTLIAKMARPGVGTTSLAIWNSIYLFLFIVHLLIRTSHQDAINHTTIVTAANNSSMNNSNNKNSDRASVANNNRLLTPNVASISSNNNNNIKSSQEQQQVTGGGDGALATSSTQQQTFRIDSPSFDHQSQVQLQQQLHNNNQMSPSINGLHSTEFTPIFPSYESQNQNYQNSLIASGSTPRLHQISHHNGFHSSNLISSNNQQQSSNGTVDDLLSSVFNPNVQSVSSSQFPPHDSDTPFHQAGEQNLWSPVRLQQHHQEKSNNNNNNNNNNNINNNNGNNKQDQQHPQSEALGLSSSEPQPTTIITIKNPLRNSLSLSNYDNNNNNNYVYQTLTTQNSNDHQHQQQQNVNNDAIHLSHYKGHETKTPRNMMNLGEQQAQLLTMSTLSGLASSKNAQASANLHVGSALNNNGDTTNQQQQLTNNKNNLNNNNNNLMQSSGGMQGSSQVTATVVNGPASSLFMPRPDLLQNMGDQFANSGHPTQSQDAQQQQPQQQQHLQLQTMSPSFQQDLQETFNSNPLFSHNSHVELGNSGSYGSNMIDQNSQHLLMAGANQNVAGGDFQGVSIESDQSASENYQKALLNEYLRIMGANGVDQQQQQHQQIQSQNQQQFQSNMIQPDSINALINSQQQHQFKTPLSEMLNHKMMAPEQLLMNNNGNIQIDSQQQQQQQQQQEMSALITSNNNINNHNNNNNNNINNNNNRAQSSNNHNNIVSIPNIQSSRNPGLEQFQLNRLKPSQGTIPINGLASVVNSNNNNHHGQHQLNNHQQQQSNKFGQSASSQIHQTMVTPTGQAVGQFTPTTNGDSLSPILMNNNLHGSNNNHNSHNTGSSEPFDTASSSGENPDLYHHASSNTNSQRDKNSSNNNGNNNNNNQGDKSNQNKKGKKRRSHDNSRTRGRTGPKSRQKHRNPANRNHLNQQFYDHDSPMDLQTSATFPLYKYKYPYPPYRRPFDDYDDDEEEEETEINVRHYNSRLGQQGLTRLGSMTTICVSIAFLIISNLSLAMSLIAHSASAFIRHFGIEPNNDRRKHHATTRRKRDISDFNGLISNGISKTFDRKDLGSLFINRYDDKNMTSHHSL